MRSRALRLDWSAFARSKRENEAVRHRNSLYKLTAGNRPARVGRRAVTQDMDRGNARRTKEGNLQLREAHAEIRGGAQARFATHPPRCCQQLPALRALSAIR